MIASKALLLIASSVLLVSSAAAQTVKVGIVNTYSGPLANLGEYIDKGMRLYIKEHPKALPPGMKVELVVRDDGGGNPDKAKQLAQELILREKVQLLGGLAFSPNAMALAPLVTEAKMPMVVMLASLSSITTASPYIVRLSHTGWQVSYPVGKWAASKYKRAYTAVSDFSPGHDHEAAFEKGFVDGGGTVLGKVRMPLGSIDFVPFMQRVKDANPEVLYGFVPAGKYSIAMMKAFRDLGLDKAGIKFVGSGDITVDDELVNMGDVALGVITVHHYSSVADRKANKAFVAAWKKEYGDKLVPNYLAVNGWDSMQAIYHVVREQKGKLDPDRTMQLFKAYKSTDSPRGTIWIDPETRDIVQTEYVREVRRVDGVLRNVEFDSIPNVKDYWKEFNKKK